eukprot:scaffold60243_cov34-Prasinocladus_malaysianus.AAC.2
MQTANCFAPAVAVIRWRYYGGLRASKARLMKPASQLRWPRQATAPRSARHGHSQARQTQSVSQIVTKAMHAWKVWSINDPEGHVHPAEQA